MRQTHLGRVMRILGAFVAIHPAFSQSQGNIDSLNAVLKQYPKDDTVKAKLLITLGEAFNKKKNGKEALASSEKALLIIANFDAPELKANALKVKAVSLNSEHQPHRFEEACDAAEQNLLIWEQLNRTQKKIEAHQLLGNIYRHKQDDINKKKHLDIALILSEQIDDKKLKCDILYDLAHTYHHFTDYKMQITCLEKLYEIAQINKDAYYLSLALCDRGLAYKLLGENIKAIECLQKSKRINEEILKSDEGLTYDYWNLGDVYKNLSDYDRALEHYTIALNLANKTENDNLKPDIHASFSYLYSDMKKHPEAIDAILKSIEAQKKLGHDENTMQGWMHLGNIYYEAGRRIESFNFYKKGLEVSRKSEHPIEIASILNGMGKIYAKEPDSVLVKIGIHPAERYAKVETLATEALEISTKNKSRVEAVTALELLSRVYEYNKDYIKAYNIYKQYITLKDSISGDDVKKQITRKEIQYEFDKKETELKFQQQLTAAQLSAQQKQNLYWVVFSTLLLGGLGTLLYFYNTLKTQKNIIAQQNELNEHMIAILSHDIKEPLLGVKLLLKKLNKEDPFVAQASKSLEGQINAVNGILNNLLKMKKLSWAKKDKNASANAHTVVKNVIQELNVAIQSKALTIHNELNDEVLMPIASEKLQIVVHNLLSNAVKYSFPNQAIRIFKEGKGFSIQDFGVGLSPEQRTKLMREVTASQRGTNQERGNGLGLFLVGAMLQGEVLKVVFDSPEVGGTIVKVLAE